MPKVIDIRKPAGQKDKAKTIGTDGKQVPDEVEVLGPIVAVEKPKPLFIRFVNIMVYDIMQKFKREVPKPIEQEKFEQYKRFEELAGGKR